MSAARSSTVEFEFAGRKFREYRAQDSHGSHCNIWMVDGKTVTYGDFQKAINKSLLDNSCWHTVRDAIRRITPDLC